MNIRHREFNILLANHGLSMRKVAGEMGCSVENVRLFLIGAHNSQRVASTIARLTASPGEVSRIAGIPVEELTREAA